MKSKELNKEINKDNYIKDELNTDNKERVYGNSCNEINNENNNNEVINENNNENNIEVINENINEKNSDSISNIQNTTNSLKLQSSSPIIFKNHNRTRNPSERNRLTSYLTSTAASIGHSITKEDLVKKVEPIIKNYRVLKYRDINFDIDYSNLENEYQRQKKHDNNYNNYTNYTNYRSYNSYFDTKSIYKSNKNSTSSISVFSNKSNKDNLSTTAAASTFASKFKRDFKHDFTQFSNKEILKALNPSPSQDKKQVKKKYGELDSEKVNKEFINILTLK